MQEEKTRYYCVSLQHQTSYECEPDEFICQIGRVMHRGHQSTELIRVLYYGKVEALRMGLGWKNIMWLYTFDSVRNICKATGNDDAIHWVEWLISLEDARHEAEKIGNTELAASIQDVLDKMSRSEN